MWLRAGSDWTTAAGVNRTVLLHGWPECATPAVPAMIPDPPEVTRECERLKRDDGYLNRCPCGYAGDPIRECKCSGQTIARYQKRVSGPLSDRIVIHVEVPRIDYEKLSDRRAGEPSAAVRERVERARQTQAKQFEGSTLRKNEDIGPRELQEHVVLDEAGEHMMQAAARQLHRSARD